MQPAVLGLARVGNFRLGQSAAAAALRATQVEILLAGLHARVRVAGLTISDIANDNPNTCSLTIDGSEAPVVAQSVRVSLNLDTPQLLFSGALQEVGLSYELQPNQLVWPASAIDDTPRANRRRPFGVWTNVSATTVVNAIMAAFAPGFTTVHVQTELPTVSIILDGSEGINGALKQITDLIGGWFFWEDGDLWLFNDPAFLGADLPDAIDGTAGRLLDAPPIAARVDDSQLRTRAFGKGHGEALLADVVAGETTLPVANAAAWFGTVSAGGHAIALSQVVAYTGVQGGGGGSMVGLGAAPNTAPSLARVAGAGLGSGVYGYAYTDVTAAGESVPSPLASITTGLIAGAGALTPTVLGGAGVDANIVDYEVTYYNAAGETAPIASSLFAFPYDVVAPTSGGTAANQGPTWGFGLNTNYCSPGDAVYFVICYRTAAGATTPGPASNTITAATQTTWGTAQNIEITGIPQPSDPAVTAIQIYMNAAGVWKGSAILPVGSMAYSVNVNVALTLSAAAPPVTNGAAVRVVALTNIPISVEPSTGRKIYRRNNGTGTFKLLTTINDTSTTTYTDTATIASLGAAAPSTNTATTNQVAVSGIAVGAPPTTSRKLYRTAVNGTQLKFLTTLANNTTTTYADATADGSLGASPPASDTSGLVLANGQVNAGATYFPVASVAPFSPGGGWALLPGGQVVRYTGTGLVGSIAFDAASTASPSSGTSLTWSHTCTGTNRLLFVEAFAAGGDKVTGIAYNAVAMTLVGKTVSGTGANWVYLYALVAPATGAHNVVVTYSTSSAFTNGSAASYTGARQTSVPDGSAVATSTTAALTATAPAVTGFCWAILAGSFDTGAVPSFGASMARANASAGSFIADTGVSLVGQPATITATAFAAANWGGIIAAFAPASVTPATSSIPSMLSGIPATGPGSILTTVKYGDAVSPAPALTGVTGIVVPILAGTPINIWAQRDDLAAQADQAVIDLANGVTPADGVYEAAPITDERRGEASLIALCDATLARYSRPLVTVTYACRDVKTKSGRPITIDLASPPIHQTLTIQEVTITEIDIAPGLLPRFSVTASNVRISLDGLLRKLLAAAA